SVGSVTAKRTTSGDENARATEARTGGRRASLRDGHGQPVWWNWLRVSAERARQRATEAPRGRESSLKRSRRSLRNEHGQPVWWNWLRVSAERARQRATEAPR